MRKLRIYLDTSVIGDYDTPEDSERGVLTKQFFQHVQEFSEDYELFISPIVEYELSLCQEPKQSILIGFLAELDCTWLGENQEAMALAEAYIKQRVLGQKHARDLTHIAYAVLARCDYIVSWNFKHMANAKTMSRVNMFNQANNYCSVNIVPPFVITGENPYEYT